MKHNVVGWFDIYVSDMSRASKFYEAVFNTMLEVMTDPTDSNVQMKAFATDMKVYGAGGALVQREGAIPGISGTTIYFSTEDCLAEEARVSAAGGRVIQPKISIGGFGWIALCMDTEGNMFGLSSMR